MPNCSKCNRPLSGNAVTRMRRGEVVHSHRICPARKFARGKKPPKRLPTRHFRRWPAQTELAHYLDRRSFVSLPDIHGVPHEILFGEDCTTRRRDLFERSEGLCELQANADCRVVATWDDGEWHHVNTQPGKRCDCLHAAKWSCKNCHQLLHSWRNPQFTQREARP